jgi:hypothetical protein
MDENESLRRLSERLLLAGAARFWHVPSPVEAAFTVNPMA